MRIAMTVLLVVLALAGCAGVGGAGWAGNNPSGGGAPVTWPCNASG